MDKSPRALGFWLSSIARYIEMKASEGLPEDEYSSTRGNQATLFQLENESCKIKISLIEEIYFAYRLLYFHEQN